VAGDAGGSGAGEAQAEVREPGTRPRRLAALVVPGLTAAWVAVAVWALVVTQGRAAPSSHGVPAVVLIGLFAATQAFVVDVQLQREARSVYISEAPTFLALMSLSPALMVLCRTVGLLIGFGLLRKQYRHPEKLAFNLALSAAEAGTAAVVFHALTGPSTPAELRWAAAAAAASASSALTAAGVGLVIELLEGAVRVGVLLRPAVEAALQAVPVAMIGAVAWAAWEDNTWAAVPLAIVSAVLLLAYRAYAQLRERHLALERLHRFSQVISRAPGVDDVLHGVLAQAREILHAERARVHFGGASWLDGSDEGVEVVLEGEDQLRRGEPYVLRDAPWALDTVVGEAQPVLVERNSRNREHRAWLDRHGLRDSVMVPMLGESGPVGLLAVDDRLGDIRGFEAVDVRVLQTVANQAAVALRNGELLDRLRHEAMHDPLTGLPNRAALQRELEGRLEAPGARFGVGILDLDAFKDVNDTLGHAHGDELLREVAERLTGGLAGQAFVARLGGDEFAVLIDDCRDAETALHVAGRLHKALDAPVLLSGIEVDVSGSLGIVLAPDHGTLPGVLLKRADLAMYEAKHNGRPTRVFDGGLDTSTPSKLALVGELRQAIAHGEVEVHVQPKLLSSTRVLCGAEALVRWRTPARGPVPTPEFVSLAERSGLIHPLTTLVLDRAIAGCAAWQSVAPGVGVSVNVSVRSLGDDALVRLVDRLLRRHDLPAQLLTLEITESHIMADPAGTLDVLHALRDRGLRLSVDDFGTGYSSLSYLRRLPVNEVKVDRSFVHRMVDEPDDAAIVRSIVELARTLGLHVVAEGVEDERTWQALEALGVDEIQGWVIAKAMPLAELSAWSVERAPAVVIGSGPVPVPRRP
jgi:diguanylate cyclase (GGDEF)-like protein